MRLEVPEYTKTDVRILLDVIASLVDTTAGLSTRMSTLEAVTDLRRHAPGLYEDLFQRIEKGRST